MRTVAIRGGSRRTTGTLYCLGRNYPEHAREMGAPPEPVVFLKPPSSLLPGGGEVPWPAGSREVHHEVELVLLLREGGLNLSLEAALRCLSSVAVGVDFTARDLQAEAKAKGQPWARSKGFPGAAPVSEFVPWAEILFPFGEIDLSLSVDGETRQSARAREMILDPVQTVAALSRWFRLEEGDLIFTGTPAGVGPVQPGQRIAARSSRLDLLCECTFLSPS